MTPIETETSTLKAIVSRYTAHRQSAAAELDELQLQPEDFTHKETQALYAAMSSAIVNQKPLDVIEMCAVTKARVRPAFVAEVVLSTESLFEAGMMRSRVLRLRDDAQRRRITETLHGILALLKSQETTEACLGELERVCQGLTGTGQRGAKPLDGSLMALVDKLEAIQSGAREATLQTGIEALDYAIGGLQPTLTIIGALPGVGKSALLVSIVRNIVARGLKVGVLSLEDERDWLTDRIMSEAASVPLFVLGNKPLSKSQMDRITDASSGVYEMLKNILVDDSPAMSPAEVVASARGMVARGCRAIIVDHLGEIRLNRSERHDLDVQDALQDLRGIAKHYRVPVVVACHLRRREGLNIDSIPRLTDFAFSASIERCARVALGLFRPKLEHPTDPVMMGIEVLKQTKGPANFNFKLNVGKLSGTVQQTPVSQAMKTQFGDWRES